MGVEGDIEIGRGRERDGGRRGMGEMRRRLGGGGGGGGSEGGDFV